MTVTAGNVMDRTAALLSDPSKITFSYALMLPFITIAWDELQEELVANHILDAQELTSSPITVTAGTKDLTSGQPSDLLFPVQIWERAVGGSDEDWEEMEERVSQPGEVVVNELEIWYWEENLVKFRGALSDRQILIRYQKDLIAIASENTVIPVSNVKSFLSHRTAALVAGSRGNKPRSAELHNKADYFLAKATSTKVTDEQDAPVRPKRYGYSRRRRP